MFNILEHWNFYNTSPLHTRVEFGRRLDSLRFKVTFELLEYYFLKMILPKNP